MTTQITQNPRLISYYREYLETQDTSRFVQQVGDSYSQTTLLRLGSFTSIESRRAVVLALSFLGDYETNTFFGNLLNDPDTTIRLLAENGIKNIWPREGNEEHRKYLRNVIRSISYKFYDEALEKAGMLIAEAPYYAEAWNQRGIANFALSRFEDAIDDSTVTLDLNPFHFGAATGMGHAYLQLRDWASAIESFRTALRINPNLNQVKKTVARIEQMIQ